MQKFVESDPMINKLLAVLILLGLAGCSGSGDSAVTADRVSRSTDYRAFTSTDAWFSPPSDFRDFEPLDKERFAPVIADLQSEAQAALAPVSATKITAEEATRFVGRPLPVGAVYVLLRAVILTPSDAGFNVAVNDRAVHVSQGCLGRRPRPMGRKALVAVLPTFPETVFTSCFMVE